MQGRLVLCTSVMFQSTCAQVKLSAVLQHLDFPDLLTPRLKLHVTFCTEII